MEIEVSRSQFAALLRGDLVVVGPTKKVITIRDGPFIVKGGPGSGFAEHVGRPGEVGGAAPEGTPPPPKKMPRQKFAGEPRGLGRVRVPVNREEISEQAGEVKDALNHFVWGSEALLPEERQRLKKSLFILTDWQEMLEDFEEDELSDTEKELGAYTLDVLDHIIDRYHLGDYFTDDQRTIFEALRMSLGDVDYDPMRHIEPGDISYVEQYLEYAPEDMRNEKWYQSQVARVMGLGLREHEGEVIFNPHEAWANGAFDEVSPKSPQ